MFYFQTESPKKSMNVSFTLFRFAYNLDPDAATTKKSGSVYIHYIRNTAFYIPIMDISLIETHALKPSYITQSQQYHLDGQSLYIVQYTNSSQNQQHHHVQQGYDYFYLAFTYKMLHHYIVPRRLHFIGAVRSNILFE